MKIIILAGGFGTRLKEVVSDVPKPMADIAGKPFLQYLIDYISSSLSLKKSDRNFILSIHHLKEKITNYFGDSMIYAIEEKPLGTGGAMINSLNVLKNQSALSLKPDFEENKDEIIVLNGDSFLQIDYQKLLEFHREKKAQITIALRKVPDCGRYGAVEIDENLRIVDFKEKSNELKEGLINGGIYVMNSEIFAQFNLPEEFSFERDFLMKNLAQIKAYGFECDNYFIDIGVPEDYFKAKEDLPRIVEFLESQGKKEFCNKALFLDRDGVINRDHGYVHKVEDFTFIDGIFDLCQKAQRENYQIFVITNQGGIAHGYYSEEDFFEITKFMESEFAKRGIKITKTFYCPFHPAGKIAKYQKNSFNRKPNSGMIFDAVKEFKIDAAQSIFIGDKEVDMMAAKGAGIEQRFLFKEENHFDFLRRVFIRGD